MYMILDIKPKKKDSDDKIKQKTDSSKNDTTLSQLYMIPSYVSLPGKLSWS